MEFVSVFVAAACAYAFGAVWYMINAKSWIKAAGIECDENGKPIGSNDPTPFVISAIMVIVVASMMAYLFNRAGIDTIGDGMFTGFSVGLFLVTPWIVTNYAYSGRPRTLTLIDAGYATIGCAIIGTVLALF